MDTQAAANRFPTTSWTSVRRSLASREELGALLEAYWGPVYAYIRRFGHDHDSAMDLTQGFIATVLLERDLLASADRELGRFRTYLLTALGRHMVDEHRKTHGRAGSSRPVIIPTDAATLAAIEPDESDDPTRAFDRQWATTVLELTLTRVEADCRERGQAVHWAVCEARDLRPICSGSTPVPLDALAETHDVTVDEARNMLKTVRRKMRDTFRSVVLETLEVEDDLDAELAELRRVLALPFV